MALAAPQIRFFQGPTGHRVAYASQGQGPLLVCAAWWVSHVEKDWGDAGFRRFFEGLAQHYTVVRYDRPGAGLSTRERSRVDLEGEVATLSALVEHLGASTVNLFALSCAGPTTVLYAARNPDRVDKLVFFGSYVDGEQVGSTGLRDAMMALVRAHWGLGSRTIADLFGPQLPRDVVKRMGKLQTASASPEMAARLIALTFDSTVVTEAAQVHAPALVLHRRRDHTVAFDAGAGLAAALPNATLQPLEGSAHVPWLADTGGDDGSPADSDANAAILRFLDAGAGAPCPQAPAADAAPTFRQRGDVWELAFDGQAAHVAHARGLLDLARLLRQPDTEVHASELWGGGQPSDRGGADNVLDEAAIAAYRTRLGELQREADAHAERGDAEGAEAYLAQRDALLQQLSAGVGLGGRRRKLGDASERARKAVTGRIRAAIRKLSAVHPALGAHLQARVSTGLFLQYKSAPGIRWRLE